jgi:signal transduction histidine kinase
MTDVREPAQRLDAPGGGGRRAASAAGVAGFVTVLALMGTVDARGADYPGTAAERALPTWALVAAALGVLVAAAAPWLLRSEHPAAATGLSVATCASLVPLWSGWPWMPASIRPAALGFGLLAAGALAEVGLRWSPSRRGSPALVAVWTLAGSAALLHVLAYDPFADPGCVRTCQAVEVPLRQVVATATAASVSAVVAAAAAGVAAVATARAARVTPLSVRAAVVGGLAALTALWVWRAGGWGSLTDQALAVVLVPVPVTVVAAAAGATVWGTLRRRAAVVRLIRQLTEGERAPEGGGGPVRAVHFSVPGEERWVDRDGEVAPPEVAGTTVELADRSGPAIRLQLAPGADAGEVLVDLGPARRLALATARLTALSRAHVRELQESQRRAVERGDTERRRIERDLHDGAQQRLVSAMFHLSLARTDAGPEGPPALDAFAGELRAALAKLREISHGAFPDVLLEEGLTPALEELVLEAGLPVTLDVRGEVRVGDDTARAAYSVVASALRLAERSAHSTAATVSVTQVNAVLSIKVENAPAPDDHGDDTDVADRVGAVGGSYDVTHVDGSRVVTAVIPCGS